MRKQRILTLVHEDLVPPDSLKGYSDREIMDWKTEYDVVSTLRELGHTVEVLGVRSDLGAIRTAIEEFRPHIAFNLLEEFHGVAVYDQHVVSYLELMRKPYTGSNPRGLLLAHDKALSKKIMAFHRIPIPRFAVFPRGRKPKRPERLRFPLFVKSLTEEASLGISQASVVTSDEKLLERVEFVHASLGTDAIVEEYIEGREIYVGILGNQRLQTLPIWELLFTKLTEGVARIATAKVKWDEKYQETIGLQIGPAEGINDEDAERIVRICKRVYRALDLSGYGRIDLRLSDNGEIYVLEANPNPDLAHDAELADAAEHAGLDYGQLVQKIVGLGLRYKAQWRETD